jgi:hypothetical protein
LATAGSGYLGAMMETPTTAPNPAIAQLRLRLLAFGAAAALGFGALAACADEDSTRLDATTTSVAPDALSGSGS